MTGKSISARPGSTASPNPISITTRTRAPSTVAFVLMRRPPYSSSSRIRSICTPSTSKDDSIVERDSADFPERFHHFVRVIIPKSEEVEILGRTQRIVEPFCQKHRTLEDKPGAVLRLAQSIEK